MMEPNDAIRLLRGHGNAELQRVADLISALTAALGQAAQTAGPRVQDSYETAAEAMRRKQ